MFAHMSARMLKRTIKRIDASIWMPKETVRKYYNVIVLESAYGQAGMRARAFLIKWS